VAAVGDEGQPSQQAERRAVRVAPGRVSDMPRRRRLKGIPLLVPCSDQFLDVPGRARNLRDVCAAVGFDIRLITCSSVGEVLKHHSVADKTPPTPVGYPIVMPIVTRVPPIPRKDGAGDAPRKGPPTPELGDLELLDTPNPRLVLFLVAQDVVLPSGFAARHGKDVIRFSPSLLTGAYPPLLHRLLGFKDRLREAQEVYQLPDVLKRARRYSSVEKRVYVRKDGFGVVEFRFEITEDEAAPALVGEEYIFRHELMLVPAPGGKSMASFRKTLTEMEVDSVSDVFRARREAFVVLPLDRTPFDVTWREPPGRSTSRKGAPRRCVVEVVVRRPSNATSQSATPPGRRIVYGIIWCAPRLFYVQKDSTSFAAVHHYDRVKLAVRFLHPKAAERWHFKTGPRLLRSGPYGNDLGYIDLQGVGDEQFHYEEYPWEQRAVPAGTSLTAEWEMQAVPKRSR